MNDMAKVIELVKTVTPELMAQAKKAYLVDNTFGILFSSVLFVWCASGFRWARESTDELNRSAGTVLWIAGMFLAVFMFTVSADALFQLAVAPDVCAIGALAEKLR